MSDSELLPVTQADREAAADLFKSWGDQWFEVECRSGNWQIHKPCVDAVQAFARHRHEAEPKQSEANAGNIVWRGEEWVSLEAYREAMSGWKAANEAQSELVEALRDCRGAIASLSEYALGGVSFDDPETGEYGGDYPIRDELLAKVDRTLKSRNPCEG